MPETMVALIGDIHANLPALEAVMADARGRGAETFWNAGDSVGYGAFPEEVVGLLEQSGVIGVIGNYDQKVLEFPKKGDKWRGTKPAQKWFAFKWAYEHLSEAGRDYLRPLPEQPRMDLGGHRILLTHASPVSMEEHVDPDTPVERLAELARAARADALVVGHSHIPFARRVREVLFINTGSVGRADDGDPRASFATLRAAPHGLVVRHHRVEYDVQREADALRRHGLPEEFVRMTQQGVSLNAILGVD